MNSGFLAGQGLIKKVEEIFNYILVFKRDVRENS